MILDGAAEKRAPTRRFNRAAFTHACFSFRGARGVGGARAGNPGKSRARARERRVVEPRAKPPHGCCAPPPLARKRFPQSPRRKRGDRACVHLSGVATQSYLPPRSLLPHKQHQPIRFARPRVPGEAPTGRSVLRRVLLALPRRASREVGRQVQCHGLRKGRRVFPCDVRREGGCSLVVLEGKEGVPL